MTLVKGNTLTHRAGKDPDTVRPGIQHTGRNASLPTPKVPLDQGNVVGHQYGGDQDPDPGGPDQEDTIAPDRRGGTGVDEGRDAGLGVIAEELGVIGPPKGEEGEARPLRHGGGPHEADPREGDPKTRGDKDRGEVERAEGRRIPVARPRGEPGVEELSQQGQQERGRRKREGQA